MERCCLSMSILYISKMLRDDPVFAEIGFDTTESGPSKVWVTYTQPLTPANGEHKHLWRQRGKAQVSKNIRNTRQASNMNQTSRRHCLLPLKAPKRKQSSEVKKAQKRHSPTWAICNNNRRSVRGERASFTRLVPGCIEATFCK